MQSPPLPSRFPCWVKAVYSWSGETKRDLGFVEGDLIECLNAGDGSWWMGRLKRDKRLMGLFPSNFVEMVDDRCVSPAPPQMRNQPRSRATSPAPPHHQNYGHDGGYSRAASPQPPHNNQYSRAASPNPYHQARGVSPNPYQQSRGVSPNHYQQNRGTSPNPYQQTRGVSPNPYQNGHDADFYQQNRARSPNPHQQQRGVSPSPYQAPRSRSPNPVQQMRAASPNPQMMRGVSPNPYQRSASPNPQQHGGSFDPYQQNRGVSPNPYQQQRAPSPYQPSQYQQARPVTPNTYGVPRATTPNPQQQGPPPSSFHMPQRAVSPNPYRAVSPAPAAHQYRAYTPQPVEDTISPPPPPPQHRNSHFQRSASPAPSFNQQNGRLSPMPSRGPSPAPSPNMPANTPSPLRSAMEDIMSSLEGMSVQGSNYDDDSRDLSRVPFSPDDYRSSPSKPPRPQSSMGSRNHSYEPTYHTNNSGEFPIAPKPTGTSNYVEKMEETLRKLQLSHSSSEGLSEQGSYSSNLSNSRQYDSRPKSSMRTDHQPSPWDLNSKARERPGLSRHSTILSNSSSAVFSQASGTSTSTAATSVSLMSGMSAGGFSATSAGSLARRKFKAMSMIDTQNQNQNQRKGLSSFDQMGLMESPSSGNRGYTFHSGESTGSLARPGMDRNWGSNESSSPSLLGGLTLPTSPQKKKSGLLKKIIGTAKAATATARSIAPTSYEPDAQSYVSSSRIVGIAGGSVTSSPEKAQDWVQVRRDVARSNTLSRNERAERQEKQEMMDQTTLNPVESLQMDVDGDEAADGGIVDTPVSIADINMTHVDKSARFVSSLPSGTTPAVLANSHLCRPHRSEIQKLRAIYTWVAEKISWDRPIGPISDSPILGHQEMVDVRRVIQNLRGTSEEVAVLVMQMCRSVGIGCEVVRGYLKVQGEALDVETLPRPNHYWNAVIVDDEWRILDASLASPTHPRRSHFSAAPNNTAEFFYFLTRPSQACYTHIPLIPAQQHIVPSLPHAILMALPCACPSYFTKSLELINFDTSLLRIEGLEIVQIDFTVPVDVECTAEVEANGFAVDVDGDVFESGDIVRKPALCQVTWEGNAGKTYRVKAVLPGDEGQGTLKVYAGPRGLMHSIKDNPHPLAFTLPITHIGDNPSYNFVTRHPTPHAQRHDLYVIQPQNLRLAADNTFVFAVRQHASTLQVSPHVNDFNKDKPAKLALQSPLGKIIRLQRKPDTIGSDAGPVYETILKCQEKGTWRGLVLADRSARWCVFAEWVCV